MEIHLVGIKDFLFKADDGTEIDGVKLFFLEEMENVKGNYGFQPGEKFMRRNVFDTTGISVKELANYINSMVFIVFNSKGRIVDLKLPQAKKA